MSDSVQDKLKGLSKDQLRQVERDVGVIRKARPNASAKSIIEAIDKHRVWAMYNAEAGEIARQAGGGNLFVGKAKPDLSVGPKEEARFAKSLDDAVGKVKASAPPPAAKARAAAAEGRSKGAGRLDKAIEKVRGAAPAKAATKPPTAPKSPRAAKLAFDPAPHAKALKAALGSNDADFQKSLRAFTESKPSKGVVESVVKSAIGTDRPFKTKAAAMKALVDRHVAEAINITRSNVIRRTPVAIAVGLGVTAAMALMGRSSSAEAKPAEKADASVPGASQRNFMPAVMANHPNRGTADFYDRPTTMAEGVARAAKTAPAQGGGRGRAPAAPEPAGKDRTKAYTDSMGRQYRNGRLIVRGQQ